MQARVGFQWYELCRRSFSVAFREFEQWRQCWRCLREWQQCPEQLELEQPAAARLQIIKDGKCSAEMRLHILAQA